MNPDHFAFPDLMVDIETMGTRSYSAIVAIGAVYFDISTGKTGAQSFITIDLQSCLDHGLVVDAGTIEWWFKQGSARKVVFPEYPRLKLKHALEFFSQTFFPHDNIRVWGNSAAFDLGILANAFEKVGLDVPWEYWQERCVRTLAGLDKEVKERTEFQGVPHHPIDDCKHQIKYCSDIYRKIIKNNENLYVFEKPVSQ